MGALPPIHATPLLTLVQKLRPRLQGDDYNALEKRLQEAVFPRIKSSTQANAVALFVIGKIEQLRDPSIDAANLYDLFVKAVDAHAKTPSAKRRALPASLPAGLSPIDALYCQDKLSSFVLCRIATSDMDDAHKRRWIASKLLKTVFAQARLPGAQKVFLMTSVDLMNCSNYYQMLEAAHAMKRAYPEWDVQLVVHTPTGSLPSVDCKEYRLKASQVLALPSGELFDGSQKTQENASVRIRLEKAHSFAGMSDFGVLIAPMEQDVERARKPPATAPILLFNDYGGVSHEGFTKLANEYLFVMGCGVDEEGIVLPPKPSKRSPIYRDPFLQQILIGAPKLFAFNQRRIPQDFLHYVLGLHQSAEDIVRIVLLSDEAELKELFTEEVLDQYDIGQVVLHTRKGAREILIARDEEKGGKTLDIYNPLPLNRSDTLSLLGFCSSPLICLDDFSFSVALSVQKLPYYEIAPHKRSFWREFTDLVQFCLPGSPLLRYCKLLDKSQPDLEEEEIAYMEEEIGTVTDQLRAYHNFSTSLLARIHQVTLERSFPELRQLEEKLVREFSEGAISAMDLCLALKDALKRVGVGFLDD